jgi:hypothetical protein
MGFIAGQDCPQVPSADDQHLIDDLGPGGEHEPFRIGVRLRIPWRDLHHFDAGTSQHCIERDGELARPGRGSGTASPAARSPRSNQQVAGLLVVHGPSGLG